MLKRFFLSERNIMMAILLNAIVIFILYFPGNRENKLLETIDRFFIYFFVLEAMVKIYVLGRRQYFSQGWNRFDFIIIMGSLPSILVDFFPIPNTSILIILRIFRLVRLVRFIRFVPHLDKILAGLGRAVKASFFVLLVLAFLNLLLALFTCHFYADIAPDYFGDPLISSFSIFQMFTVEGWNDIPAEIAANLKANGSPQGSIFSPEIIIGVTRFYFVIVVLVGGVFGLSLANAVFVDEMTMDNTDAIEAKIDSLRQELVELKELLKEKQG
jgi:voltage-gated sodium channel